MDSGYPQIDFSRVKALFVGISYQNTSGSPDLHQYPRIYAKMLMNNILEVKQTGLTKEKCLFLADCADLSVLTALGVQYGAPCKKNVMAALKAMIENAQEGDLLLFYYCGHAGAWWDGDKEEHYQREVNENKSWGFLKTLKDDGGRNEYLDVLYDFEFHSIVNQLQLPFEKVNLTMLFHACHSGAMFTNPGLVPHPYKGVGIAVTSVDPNIPAIIEGGGSRQDLTVWLQDNVIKPFLQKKDPSEWPNYQETFDIITQNSEDNPSQDGTKYFPQMYYNADIIGPTAFKFLLATKT